MILLTTRMASWSVVFRLRIAGVVLLLLISAVFILLPSWRADAQQPPKASPEIGLSVAHNWCSKCHVVSGAPRKSAANAPPTFIEIANNKDITRSHLLAMLSNPHGFISPNRGFMPAPPLTRDEIRHVIAYIISLRTQRN